MKLRGVALALAALVAGCGSPEPYETTSGAPVRLDGEGADMLPLTIAAALEHPGRSSRSSAAT